MPRSKVTQLIQDFNALNEVEQKVFLDQVDPQPEPEQQPKKSNKKAASVTRKGRCAACDYAKAAPIHHDATLVGYHVYQATPRSPRAHGLPPTITKTPKGESEKSLDADAPKCGICGNVPDHSDHDPTYLSSHVFEVPKSATSATRRSSRKGAVTNSTPNSETPAANAAVAAGGSSE